MDGLANVEFQILNFCRYLFFVKCSTAVCVKLGEQVRHNILRFALILLGSLVMFIVKLWAEIPPGVRTKSDHTTNHSCKVTRVAEQVRCTPQSSVPPVTASAWGATLTTSTSHSSSPRHLASDPIPSPP